MRPVLPCNGIHSLQYLGSHLLHRIKWLSHSFTQPSPIHTRWPRPPVHVRLPHRHPHPHWHPS